MATNAAQIHAEMEELVWTDVAVTPVGVRLLIREPIVNTSLATFEFLLAMGVACRLRMDGGTTVIRTWRSLLTMQVVTQ